MTAGGLVVSGWPTTWDLLRQVPPTRLSSHLIATAGTSGRGQKQGAAAGGGVWEPEAGGGLFSQAGHFPQSCGPQAGCSGPATLMPPGRTGAGHRGLSQTQTRTQAGPRGSSGLGAGPGWAQHATRCPWTRPRAACKLRAVLAADPGPLRDVLIGHNNTQVREKGSGQVCTQGDL